VVAIITVLFTPTAMRMLEHRSPASGTEQQRLDNEQASARAYTSTIERVLIPASAELHPELAMEALENLALSQNQAEITESDIDLVILGCTDRGQGSQPYLGGTVERLLSAAAVPLILL
jgi:acetyl-CoA acetyltransferase